MTKKILIKQDINFLEYPIWIQDSDRAEKSVDGYVWEDGDGYVYRAGYKPPVRIDLIFLYFLMMKSQDSGWAEEIELTRYEVLKACDLSKGSYWYNRLEESLERWKMIGIEFKGKFYDGKHYVMMNFGIIDHWNIEENSEKLHIRFSPEFLMKIKESNSFKLIDFEQLKALKSPLATRLYEILVKSFQGRERWEIDAIKLAQKIPMQEKYPAYILPKIKAALNRLNETTELKVSLEVRRLERGKAILIFEKIDVSKDIEGKVALLLDLSSEKKDNYFELLGLMRETERNKISLQAALQGALRKHGLDYVRRNILYANKNANKNYRSFLVKALSEDWGKTLCEEEKAKEEVREREIEQRAIQKRQEEADERMQVLRQQASELLKVMGVEKKASLRQRALMELSSDGHQNILEAAVRMQMIAIVVRDFE